MTREQDVAFSNPRPAMILSLNVKVTDLRFQLPLSLFCLLTSHLLFFFIVLLLTLSLVSSVKVQLSQTISAFPFFHLWLRGVFVKK